MATAKLKTKLEHEKVKEILEEETEEIKKIFTDVGQTVPKNGTWYRYSSRKASRSPDADMVRRYKELRDEKKLQRMIITNDELARTKRW